MGASLSRDISSKELNNVLSIFLREVKLALQGQDQVSNSHSSDLTQGLEVGTSEEDLQALPQSRTCGASWAHFLWLDALTLKHFFLVSPQHHLWLKTCHYLTFSHFQCKRENMWRLAYETNVFLVDYWKNTQYSNMNIWGLLFTHVIEIEHLEERKFSYVHWMPSLCRFYRHCSQGAVLFWYQVCQWADAPHPFQKPSSLWSRLSRKSLTYFFRTICNHINQSLPAFYEILHKATL